MTFTFAKPVPGFTGSTKRARNAVYADFSSFLFDFQIIVNLCMGHGLNTNIVNMQILINVP